MSDIIENNMFWLVIVGLFIIAFLWALFSLRKELHHPKELADVKKEFLKERVLYKK